MAACGMDLMVSTFVFRVVIQRSHHNCNVVGWHWAENYLGLQQNRFPLIIYLFIYFLFFLFHPNRSSSGQASEPHLQTDDTELPSTACFYLEALQQ
jgi:hypothetical protein